MSHMVLIVLAALLALTAAAGAWYGRLLERAAWTRRLMERGINPSTLYPRGGGSTRPTVEPLLPLDADTDRMRETMEEMAREVERLAEGQRFITDVLSERRAGRPDRAPDSGDGPG